MNEKSIIDLRGRQRLQSNQPPISRQMKPHSRKPLGVQFSLGLLERFFRVFTIPELKTLREKEFILNQNHVSK